MLMCGKTTTHRNPDEFPFESMLCKPVRNMVIPVYHSLVTLSKKLLEIPAVFQRNLHTFFTQKRCSIQRMMSS